VRQRAWINSFSRAERDINRTAAGANPSAFTSSYSMAAKVLAEWAVNLQFSDLPPSTVKAAVRSFHNWFGCAIGGSTHEAVTITKTSLSPFFGKATSSLIGQGTQTDAQHAALINGIASHVHDYDDTHLQTIIHPTGPVASALLAYAEFKGGVAGVDFILALTAGIEAECKLGLAVWPEHYDVGWHITSTTGSIGAAVAVGSLMKLNVEAMQHAIGIAATQVTGLREMFGSHTKAFHAGRAAQNGLLAALLAGKGFTSSAGSLDGKRGWANVVSTRENIDGVFSTLATTWEIEQNAFKPFPCGIVIHPIIDGCIQVREELLGQNKSAADIQRVDIEVNRLVLELTGKKKPKDGLEGKFSVYYGAAIGLVLGRANPAQYEDSVVQDTKIIDIRDKVTAVVTDIPPESCRIVVVLKNGERLEKQVLHAVGSVEAPMTDEQLHEKFMDQATVVVGEKMARQYSDACLSLQNASNVSELLQMH
jgi:aconitate decarboxylase